MVLSRTQSLAYVGCECYVDRARSGETRPLFIQRVLPPRRGNKLLHPTLAAVATRSVAKHCVRLYAIIAYGMTLGVQSRRAFDELRPTFLHHGHTKSSD